MENQLVLTEKELLSLGATFAYYESEDKVIAAYNLNYYWIERNNLTGVMSRPYCGQRIIFKDRKDFFDWVQIDDPTINKPVDDYQKVVDQARQEQEKIKDDHPCPNIQEELNKNFAYDKKSLSVIRKKKKELESVILEKIQNFEDETGCFIDRKIAVHKQVFCNLDGNTKTIGINISVNI
jgi:hypothetical protein